MQELAPDSVKLKFLYYCRFTKLQVLQGLADSMDAHSIYATYALA